MDGHRSSWLKPHRQIGSNLTLKGHGALETSQRKRLGIAEDAGGFISTRVPRVENTVAGRATLFSTLLLTKPPKFMYLPNHYLVAYNYHACHVLKHNQTTSKNFCRAGLYERQNPLALWPVSWSPWSTVKLLNCPDLPRA